MEVFKRFLMSQHLGQVEASVTLDTLPRGAVSLSGSSLKGRSIQFTFSPDELQRVFGDAVHWEEMAIRLAVSQAHKIPEKPPAQSACIPLEVEAAPWV